MYICMYTNVMIRYYVYICTDYRCICMCVSRVVACRRVYGLICLSYTLT